MEAFYTFLQDNNLTALIDRLKRIENHYRGINELHEDDKQIWFRFFDGDPLATTITDIAKAFSYDTPRNREYMRDNLTLCCYKAEIQVYYS